MRLCSVNTVLQAVTVVCVCFENKTSNGDTILESWREVSGCICTIHLYVYGCIFLPFQAATGLQWFLYDVKNEFKLAYVV